MISTNITHSTSDLIIISGWVFLSSLRTLVVLLTSFEYPARVLSTQPGNGTFLLKSIPQSEIQVTKRIPNKLSLKLISDRSRGLAQQRRYQSSNMPCNSSSVCRSSVNLSGIFRITSSGHLPDFVSRCQSPAGSENWCG
jgi:hypothetical protein